MIDFTTISLNKIPSTIIELTTENAELKKERNWLAISLIALGTLGAIYFLFNEQPKSETKDKLTNNEL